MTAGGDAVIIEWLEANPNARLIIIDTFEKMRGSDPQGVSAYAGDYAAAVRFKNIADHYGVPILLIHHVRKQGADDFQSMVSGTNGLTGAMDAIMVLERGRGQADGVLHVTGRDVEETDYAMSFDAKAGAWTKLDGDPSDYQLQNTRVDILRLLRDHGPMKPAMIAESLQLNPASVRQTCKRMADDGQLKTVPGGIYRAPDSSDSSDTTALSQLSLCHSTTSEQDKHQ